MLRTGKYLYLGELQAKECDTRMVPLSAKVRTMQSIDYHCDVDSDFSKSQFNEAVGCFKRTTG